MSHNKTTSLTRRQLLELVGIGGAALALPKGVSGAAKPAATAAVTCTPLPAAEHPLPMFEFISSMAGLSEKQREQRVCFDRRPLETIKEFKLSGDQWKTYMSMDPGEIKDAVKADLYATVKPQEAASAIYKAWEIEFDDFASNWKCGDGYDPCDRSKKCKHQQGDPCESAVTKTQQKMFYAKPSPEACELMCTGNKHTLHGEGFLPRANLRIVRKSDGKEVHNAEAAVRGSFRCSVIDIPETFSTGETMKRNTVYVFYVKNSYNGAEYPFGPVEGKC